MTRAYRSYSDAARDVRIRLVPLEDVEPETVIDGEEWRVIARNPRYAVSSCGRVMALFSGHGTRLGQVLHQKPNSNGYPRVAWMIAGKRKYILVHHLVCEAFHGPRPSPLHEAAHKNGQPSDCSKGNLRWSTRQENAADMVDHGTAPRGERNGRHRYSEAVIREIRSAPGPQRAIARRFGMSEANVSQIRSGKIWRHL